MPNMFHKEQPCPFCGGPALLHSEYRPQLDQYAVFDKCLCCGARGAEIYTRKRPRGIEWDGAACKKAIAAWNQRTAQEV